MMRKSNLDKKNIKKIDKLLKTINKNIYDCNEEIYDFNEEIENNILIEINDLIKKGLSEDIAVEKVINNFGNKEDLSKDIDKTFNKIIFKKLLLVSSMGVILGFIIYIFSNLILIDNKFFQGELGRNVLKTSLLVTAISLLLFVIWEIANIIYTKRSGNFIYKLIPLNLIGLIDILIFIFLNNIHSVYIYSFLVFFLRISLLSIPIFYYLFVRNKNLIS